MSKKLNFHLAPAQLQVRMVALFLRCRADAVHEVESLFEVRKFVNLVEVVPVHHFPTGQLFERHLAHSPRSVTSYDRMLRFSDSFPFACGTSNHSTSSTVPQLSHTKW